MEIKERIILPTDGTTKRIGEIFNRSQPFVRACLRGETNHPDAGKIRKYALENGGAIQHKQTVTVL